MKYGYLPQITLLAKSRGVTLKKRPIVDPIYMYPEH